MKTFVLVVVCLSLVALSYGKSRKGQRDPDAPSHATPGDVSHGWGENINWVTWDEARDIAAKEDKPIMVVLHKSWCGACKRLKPQFADNEKIAELSKNFVMVNAEDDEPPHSDPSFQKDGGYIPRIYFTDKDGKVMDEYYNTQGSDKYKYFYATADSIPPTMEKVMSKA